MQIELTFLFFILSMFGCGNNTGRSRDGCGDKVQATTQDTVATDNNGYKVIHVFVALCDNKYQGIVPVPPGIGNGQNPATNLYWGAGNGVKSYFKRSTEWSLLKIYNNPEANILERVIFRNKSAKVYLVADAYDGQFIKETTIDFLTAASGEKTSVVIPDRDTVYCGGASNLIAYVGHDALMDFKINTQFSSKRKSFREAIILACYSKNYFSNHLRSTGAIPLIWTTGLMAPEAYTLHDGINAWFHRKSRQEIRTAAAKAYSKFQNCSMKAANNLFTGD